jgi:dolichol-phosphate mannosyltransferase
MDLVYYLDVGNVSNLIIIPTYNEEETIELLLGKLNDIRFKLRNDLFDVLIVDDSSPDSTVDKISALEYPWVNLQIRPAKNGLATAYKFGFAWAQINNYAFAIEMDADGSHRVEDLVKLLQADSQYDLVIGSRWTQGGNILNWPAHRIVISRMGNFYAKHVLRMRIDDSTSGFRRIKLNKLKNVDMTLIRSKGYGFQVELALAFWRCGFTIKEIPITFIEREYGVSKMTVKIAFEAFWNVTYLAIKRKNKYS